MNILKTLINRLRWALAAHRARRIVRRVMRQYPGCDGALNAWPTPSAGYAASPVATTIKWGTDGLTTVCTVIDASQAQEVERVYIENGTGIKTTRVLLAQGANWNFTIVDSTALTPPAVGDLVTVVNMLGTGAINTYKGMVVENNYQAARKQEGHRIIQVEALNLVDSVAAAASPSL